MSTFAFSKTNPHYSFSEAGMSKKRIGSGSCETFSETLCLVTMEKDILLHMYSAAFNTFLRYACFDAKLHE